MSNSVLIITADMEWANVYRWALHTAGFAVAIAEDARRGIDAAKTLHPDGIVLQLELPDKNGISVLKHLREHGFEHTPVVFLTWRFKVPTIEAALDTGARIVLDSHTITGSDIVNTFKYGLGFRPSKPRKHSRQR